MQIHHLFWIPSGLPAKNGVYVEDNEQDLLNVLALESVMKSEINSGRGLGDPAVQFSGEAD